MVKITINTFTASMEEHFTLKNITIFIIIIHNILTIFLKISYMDFIIGKKMKILVRKIFLHGYLFICAKFPR